MLQTTPGPAPGRRVRRDAPPSPAPAANHTPHAGAARPALAGAVWATRCRGLVKDYERDAETLAGLHVVAFGGYRSGAGSTTRSRGRCSGKGGYDPD